MWLDQRMAFKWGNSDKPAGDAWIGLGGVLCILSFLLFIIGAANGVPNGLTLTGGVLIGLLMIIAGYLKRISVALTAQNAEQSATSAR